MKILAGFAVVLALILFGFADAIIRWFASSSLTETGQAAEGINMPQANALIKTSLYFIFFCIVLENIKWAFNGLLTAAGDTIFLLIAGTISLWVFCFLPTYFLVYVPKASILYAYAIQVAYGILSAGVIYMRFKQGKWKNIKLVQDEPTGKELLEELIETNTLSSVEQSDSSYE